MTTVVSCDGLLLCRSPFTTMPRKKHLRISDEEHAVLENTRQIVYGDNSVPYGVVIEQACQSLLNEGRDGVQF